MSPSAIPPVESFADIHRRAKEKTADQTPRAALIVPSESRALPAFLRAADENLIDPLIIGNEKRLRSYAKEASLKLDGIKILDLDRPDLGVQTAMKMAESGDLDMIVQGRISNEEIVAALVTPDSEFVGDGNLLSHLGVIKPKSYARMIAVSDGMVHEKPDLKTKLFILTNLSQAAETIGLPEPAVAVVAAVEAIYPQMPATLDGAILAKMSSRGQIKGMKVDGPLSFDIAVDPEAARAKGIVDSEVAGRANAMLASTRHVAAGICQAMSLFADCEVGHVIVGGRVPVAAGFFGDSVGTRLNSILLAITLA